VASLFRMSVAEMENNFEKVSQKLPLIFGWIMNDNGQKFVHLPLIPLTSEQMICIPRVKINNVIIKALNWFHRNLYPGERSMPLTVGLGAYTSVVSKNGFLLRPPGRSPALKPRLYQKISVVSGDTTTAIAVEMLIIKACHQLRLGNPKILIIGGTGTVGQRLIRLLIHDNFDKDRIHSLSKKASKARHFELETGIQSLTWEGGFSERQISDYDIVIITTSGQLKISGQSFRGVKLVIDLTMPRFIKSIIHDIPSTTFTIDGGWVQLPEGFFFNGVDMGLPDRQTIFACLAETFMACIIPEKIREVSNIKDMLEIKEIFQSLKLNVDNLFQLSRRVEWPKIIIVPVEKISA